MIFRGIALASFLAIPALAQSAVDSADFSQGDSSWVINGSVGAEFGYHSVVTQKNESDEIFVNGKDSVSPGKKYRNYFQVPGIFGAWNVFLHMESPSGQKIDFTLDASSDKWRKFDPYNPYQEDKSEKEEIQSLDSLFDVEKQEEPKEKNNNEANVEGNQNVITDDEVLTSNIMNQRDSNIPTEPKLNNETKSKNDSPAYEMGEDEADLEKELEAKFDELFGPIDDDNNNE